MGALDRFKLDDKVAIVTGAGTGLGAAMAQGLAEAGADIVLAARRVDKLRETAARVEATGRRAHVVEADVADRAACDRVAQEATETFGRLDVLVNNAGLGLISPALRQEPEDFERTLAVNLAGCHWMALAAARAMVDGGSIINISSISALTTYGIPQAGYAASKAGLIALTRALAGEWGTRRGIRVNAIAPGFFVTEMTEGHLEGFDARIPRICLGRMGTPDELVGAAIYLASDASSYTTGETLVVDGGFATG
jgi:NAD(P)-dependent dehydrogenase (short-subunit alcohol dehydrogenase family)